jgi:hypothetical protein
MIAILWVFLVVTLQPKGYQINKAVRKTGENIGLDRSTKEA